MELKTKLSFVGGNAKTRDQTHIGFESEWLRLDTASTHCVGSLLNMDLGRRRLTIPKVEIMITQSSAQRHVSAEFQQVLKV